MPEVITKAISCALELDEHQSKLQSVSNSIKGQSEVVVMENCALSRSW
jgi:hypothetical protein